MTEVAVYLTFSSQYSSSLRCPKTFNLNYPKFPDSRHSGGSYRQGKAFPCNILNFSDKRLYYFKNLICACHNPAETCGQSAVSDIACLGHSRVPENVLLQQPRQPTGFCTAIPDAESTPASQSGRDLRSIGGQRHRLSRAQQSTRKCAAPTVKADDLEHLSQLIAVSDIACLGHSRSPENVQIQQSTGFCTAIPNAESTSGSQSGRDLRSIGGRRQWRMK